MARTESPWETLAMLARLSVLAFALAPDAALACGNCSSGGGGVPLPAPAGVALFALGVTLLLTRRRSA
jgi:hypothetical protein